MLFTNICQRPSGKELALWMPYIFEIHFSFWFSLTRMVINMWFYSPDVASGCHMYKPMN